MVKYSFAIVAVALSGQYTTAFLSLSQKTKTAFSSRKVSVLQALAGMSSSVPALPDSLELPPPSEAVTEAISAVTNAAPPAPEITESVTSSLPSLPDVSLPSISLPDVSDITSGLDSGLLPIVGLLAFAAVVGLLATSGGDTESSSTAASTPVDIFSFPHEPPAPSAPPVDEDVDISIPYDAAAKMAYEAADSKGDYAEFKENYEKTAVEDVIKKQKKKRKKEKK